nr:hypothetical protein [Streptomyces sp. HYC2]
MATRLISTTKRTTDKERLSTLPQLEKASRLVARASKVFIEELELVEEAGCDVDVAALWRALEEVAPRAALSSAAAAVVSLVPEDDESAEIAMRGALALRYNTVKPFLSLLGETSMLGAATGGDRRQAGAGGGEAAAGPGPAPGDGEAAAATGDRGCVRSCRGRWTGGRRWSKDGVAGA